MSQGAVKRFTLYGNSYCHLCTEMYSAIMGFSPEYTFEIDVVDIEGESELEESFGEKIPVLMHDSKELCHYYLDENAFRACFR